MHRNIQIIVVAHNQLLRNPEHPPVYGSTLASDPSVIVLSQRIKTTGHVQPLVVSLGTPDVADGTIVNGTRRWVAAGLAGLTDLPVIYRKFSSAEEMKRVMILDNEQREKDEWTKTVEFVTVFFSYKAEAREQQRAAARRTNAKRQHRRNATGCTTSEDLTLPSSEPLDDGAQSSDPPDAEEGSSSSVDRVDVGDRSDADGGNDDEAPYDSSTAGGDDCATPSGAVRSPSSEGPASLKSPRAGEAFKRAREACGGGTSTLEARLRLWEEARRRNPADPSASAVAKALRVRGAKVEAVARDFGLSPRSSQEGTAKGLNGVADPLAIVGAFRGLVQNNIVPPGSDPSALADAVQTAVEAGAAFLKATMKSSLRLVHRCPRHGENLPPLKDAQMQVSEKLLRKAIEEARSAGWSRGRIARECEIDDPTAAGAFRAWTGDENGALRPQDLYRLARWVEANRGRSPAKKRAARKGA